MKSNNRTCACWSKIKPPNGGLENFFFSFFFQRKPEGETSLGKSDKSRVVLVEVVNGGGLET